MGGSSRGGRESYAARRGGGAEAASMDRAQQRKLEADNEPKVFLSYQYKNDVQKVNLIRHQAENSEQLTFTETSSRERYPENWKPYALKDIKRADEVVVMVGKETYKSKAVAWEVKKAHKEGVPVMVIKLKEEVKIPRAIAQGQDRVTNWDLEKVRKGIEKDQDDKHD